MNRLIKVFTTLLVVLSGSTLAANSDCCAAPCAWRDCSYSVFVDYLYWKPTRATLFIESLDERVKFLDLDYNSGYRVGGSVGYHCWDLGIRYTYYHSSSTENFADQTLQYRLDYDVLDIELGYHFPLSCICGYIKPIVGAKLAWIDDDTENLGAFQFKLDYRGYGIYLGGEGNIDVLSGCVPIAFVTRGTISLLQGRFGESQSEQIFINNDYTITRVYELYAGFELTLACFSCVDARVEIGYELQNWLGFPNPSETTCSGNFGLSGLVVGVKAGF